MAGAAGRVEDLEVARILERSRGALVFEGNEVLATVGETGFAVGHLDPGAAECVVDEELDDVAGREELVADGELAAVPRCLALIAHPLSFFLAVEELVEPADRLVVVPDRRELGGVELAEHGLEGVAAGPEQAGGVVAVEEDLDFGGELVEERLEVEPVAGRVTERCDARGEAGELAVARRALAVGDGRLDQLAGFEAS